MNFRFGKNIFGRWIYGGKIAAGGGGGDTPVSTLPLSAREYFMRVYAADGTKTAEFGSAIKDNPVSSLSFDISKSGCGKLDFTLAFMPKTTVLSHGSRVDIHLFNDSNPWYSGFIIDKPVPGSTAKSFKYTGHGYVEQLKRVIVDQTYQGMDVAMIAKNILQNIVEPETGILYASNKIVRAGYTVQKLRFDHRSAYECMKELAEYATDYVWGVDAYRHFFFKPITEEVNEQARFYVGIHINEYEPTEDIDSIVNHAFIKGAELDENGSNFMAEVTDAASIATYGLRQAVLEVPSAVTTADATRWGITEVGKRKDPKKKAKIKGLRLEYPNADGSFNVRRLSPEGKAAITTLPMLVDSSGSLAFARNSVAYRNDGKQVAVNEPRFEKNLTVIRPAVENVFPVNSVDFVTGWVKYRSAVVTVSDYPVYIPEFGNVMAKRIQTVGGSNALKTYTTASGRPNPHTDTVSIWGMVLSGSASLRNNLQNPVAFSSEMRRISSTLTYAGTITQLEFWAANAASNLDIVVYQPMINEGQLGEYTPPGTTRAAVLNGTPLGAKVEVATSNLAKTSNYGGDGGAVVSATDVKYSGTSNKKIVTGSSGNFFLNSATNITQTAGTAFTVSFKIRREDGAAMPGIGMYLYVSNNTNVNLGYSAANLTDLGNGWYLAKYTRSGLVSGAVSLAGGMGLVVGASYIVDDFMIEALAYNTSPTVLNVTRAAEILSFPTTGMDKNNLDIQVYAGPTIETTAYHKMIFGAWGFFYLSRGSSANSLLLSWMDGTQKYAYVMTIADSLTAGHVFRLTYNGTTAKVFVDGVEKISTPANFADPLPASIAIGQFWSGNTSYPGNCNFRDLLVSRSIRQPGQVQLENITPDENTLLYAPLTSGLGYTGQSLQTETHEYPIAKVKYSGDSTKISTDLELGEPAYAIADDFKQIYRDKKQADHLASLNNLQLKGGSL